MGNVPAGSIIQSHTVKETKPDPQIYEIIDINFGKKNIKELIHLKKLTDLKKKFDTNCKKLAPEVKETLKAKEIDKLIKENEKLSKDFEVAKTKYFNALENKDMNIDQIRRRDQAGIDDRNFFKKIIKPESKS